LPVYFQLRFSQLTTQVDEALKEAASHGAAHGQLLPIQAPCRQAQPFPAMGPGSSGGVELAVFGAVHDALVACWRPQTTWVKELSHKFLRLSLQVAQRLALWLHSLLDGKVKAAPPSKPPPQQTGAKAFPGGAAGAAPGAAAPPSATPPAEPVVWVLSAGDMVGVASDARRLASWIETDLAAHASALVGISDDEESRAAARAAVSAALAGASELFRQVSRLCWEKVAAEVATRCEREVGAVRGVTASYRMTNKPAPTGPSPFVPSLLAPLAAFAEAHDAKAPENDHSSAGSSSAAGCSWRLAVLGVVVARYGDAVTELLATVRTMDEALKKRMAKKKATSGAAGDAAANAKLSDADKIGLQLWLDATQLGKDLSRHGLDVQGSRPFTSLMAQLEPFGEFLGRA
jgi:hypothetical protein